MIRILIFDGNPLFLRALKKFLLEGEKFDVCEAGTAEDAISCLKKEKPEITLLDLTSPDDSGMTVLRYMREHMPEVPTILLAIHIHPEQTVEAMRLGLRGIILKNCEPQEFVVAIEAVLNGRTYFDPEVAEAALIYSITKPQTRNGAKSSITPREKEIIELVCLGMRNRDIATRCKLTEGTVKAHLHSIFQKMGVASRAELIVGHALESRHSP